MFGKSLIDASPPGPLIESIVGIGELPELFRRIIASHLHFHKSGIFNFRFNSLQHRREGIFHISLYYEKSPKSSHFAPFLRESESVTRWYFGDNYPRKNETFLGNFETQFTAPGLFQGHSGKTNGAWKNRRIFGKKMRKEIHTHTRTPQVDSSAYLSKISKMNVKSFARDLVTDVCI